MGVCMLLLASSAWPFLSSMSLRASSPWCQSSPNWTVTLVDDHRIAFLLFPLLQLWTTFNTVAFLTYWLLQKEKVTLALIASAASNLWLRVKGPDKISTKMSKNFLIAIYFSHLPVFSYKNLRLCKESLMLLEYHQKIGTFCLYQRI